MKTVQMFFILKFDLEKLTYEKLKFYSARLQLKKDSF